MISGKPEHLFILPANLKTSDLAADPKKNTLIKSFFPRRRRQKAVGKPVENHKQMPNSKHARQTATDVGTRIHQHTNQAD